GGQAIVAGDVVNTASRLQSVAPPGGVLVCGPTYAATKSAIRYAEHESVVLRGRSTATEVWLALAPVQRQQPDREADPTPLVDREHELGLLVNALHRSLRERIPQLVTVFGRAGIGKSRLVRELFRHAERLIDQPVAWRTGRCPPFGENVTFSALADIVKAEAGILDTDPAAVAAERLAVALHDLVGEPEAGRLADAIGPLAGLPGSKLPAEEAESAWRRFVIALAARRPTILLFEDVHWADEPMRRFIELLGASVREVPLLLLCTARPELVERDPSWAGTITGSLTITLPPLRDTAIATLYAQLFGQAAFSADLLSPLVELADGNPLYAHEYVRMLIERGALRQSGRGWALEGDHDLPMPDNVHAVIANRVDLLESADRAVLQAASVVGMQFWPGAVSAALGRPVETVERCLRRLEQRDFVHEQPDSTMAGQSEFRFRHVLVRDVCYQRLPRTERVARHERTAGWLDAVSRTRDTDLAEVLAHHRWAAHEIARTLGVDAGRYAPAARDALERAAQRAYALGALDQAATHIGRALALFGPHCADDPVERLKLELFATEIAFYRDGSAFLSGGGQEQLTALAERLYAHGDQAQAARAWTLLGQAAWLRADRGAALSCLDRAVELFDSLPDSAEKAEAYAELGRLHMLNYELEPAVAAAGAAAEIAERLGLVEVQANARITVGTVLFHAGDPAGLGELHAAYELCRGQQLRALPRAVQNLASALREEGESERSDTLLVEAARPLVGQGGHTLATGYSHEAMRAYFAGDFERQLAAADAFADAAGGLWDVQVRGLRNCLRVLRDEPVPGTDSSDDVVDAVDTARSSGFHRPLWTALSLGALCRALQGRGAEAGVLLDELADAWRKVPALASGEWVGAAAHAAAIAAPTAGRDVPARLHAMLTDGPRQTPWSRAALCTVQGALATADGNPAAAGAAHEQAAALYAACTSTTDRMLSLALGCAAWQRAADRERTELGLTEVRAFALRNAAPGLLELTGESRVSG
ncbi:MAG TPA: AAA family ATPase, partial [Micromonosporaceae bacterium]|nr:AAA family ATPase [Micromonosporaceae bacterium]